MGDAHHCSGPRVEWDVKLYYTVPYLAQMLIQHVPLAHVAPKRRDGETRGALSRVSIGHTHAPPSELRSRDSEWNWT